MLQGAHHVADEPVRGGRAGGHPHGMVAAHFLQVQFLLRLHMVGGDAGGPGDFHQPLGVAAVAAPHHHQGLGLAGQILDLRLAGGGGVADGVKDAGLRKAGLDFRHPGFEQGFTLGGLGHHDEVAEFRQGRHILGAHHHVAPALGVAQQALHLRVVGVADDEGGVALGGPTPDDGLHLGHPGAGGVDDAGPLALQLPPLLGRDAVGPDHHQAFRHRLPRLEHRNPPLPQQIQHLGIVNQGTVGIDLGLAFVDGL